MQKLKDWNIKLVASKEDTAGMNIARFIKDNLKDRLSFIESKTIYSDQELQSLVSSTDSLVIFLSRHTAKSLRPSFTVHPVGNFSQPMFGGKESTLVNCNSFLLKHLLLNIQNLVASEKYGLTYNYEVSLEVTHHGPFTTNSVAFIEVGSSMDQWQDLEACHLIADAVNNTDFRHDFIDNDWKSVVGFGGNHYSKKFTKLVLESEFAFGHICPKYAIEHLTEDLTKEMIEKTYPTPKIALFDKKSMKRKSIIRDWLTGLGLEVLQV
ncbi:MAG: D-aminoacyl-tRNA deacylase [Candidatus Hodarchaeales archaeon]